MPPRPNYPVGQQPNSVTPAGALPRPPYTVCFRRYSLLLGTFALALTFSATIAATADAQNLGSLTTALFAGIPGQNGTTDGPPGTATFSGPGDLTTDGTDLWVGGGTVIRRVTPSTGVVATVAGRGATGAGYVDDPVGVNARFGNTSSVCAYGGTIWIGDGPNHRLRAMSAVAPFGVTTVAGSGAAINLPNDYHDGFGTAATIDDPRGLVCHGGFVYFLESGASTLRRFDPATGQVVTLAGSPFKIGVVEGFGAAARFISPRHMTVIGDVLYISDTNGGTIRSYDLASAYVDVVWGTVDAGYVDGVGAAVRVHRPRGITTDGTHLYWAEYNKHTIRKGVLSTFEVGTVAGVPSLVEPCGCPGGYVEGTGPNAVFNGP